MMHMSVTFTSMLMCSARMPCATEKEADTLACDMTHVETSTHSMRVLLDILINDANVIPHP